MISLDTETTGVDFRHGALPFLVTTCTEEGEQTFWEWAVDPLTRRPIVPAEDLDEIQATIDAVDEIVLQNGKFDVAALTWLFRTFSRELRWDWGKAKDTLVAGHVLASNQPHDLTSMGVQYLGVNIQPFEDAVQEATNEARRIARRDFPTWRIAKKDLVDEDGRPVMPSAKEKTWKYDMWLPRALAKELGYAEDHPWWTVCSEYANPDSAVTTALFPAQKRLLIQRGLWEIYLASQRLVEIIYDMEQRGITVSEATLTEIETEFKEESAKANAVCTSIAKGFGYELTLPKTGNNGSMSAFLFGKRDKETFAEIAPPVMPLPVLKRSEKTGEPSLDKTVLEEYESILKPNSKELTFVKALRGKRKRDTALSYMEGYRRFWIPVKGVEGWYVLHPSLNQTGTDTLRFSSSSPNEQNISKQEDFNIRRCFGPLPGREWWSLDYENIELRIPAYESGEESMIELFERPDDPPYFGSYHLLNASIVYPDLFWPIAEKKDEFKKRYKSSWYQSCKNGGFAIQYGCQEAKADATFKRKGAYRSIKERLPKVAKLTQKWIDFANKNGYVETLPDKTVCPERGYPVMCSRTEWGKISPTIPLSYHIQSTAMQATRKAMIRTDDYLKELTKRDPRGYYLALQVHDELVVDFPKGGARNLPKVRKIQHLMSQSGDDIGIPLRVSISYHPNNWGEEEKVK